MRFLNVISLSNEASDAPQVSSKYSESGSQIELKITTRSRNFEVNLPIIDTAAGEIAVSGNNGKLLLERRPFPSGQLPHGPEGMRLLDSWDAVYRGGNHPGWDAGRPSGELQRVVEQGTVRTGRAIDLGCGSGTDAIYLASKGFDVTAIDIAPTALSQAKEKADKAGVRVRWLLADVLAAPNLGSYEFIFDRGCYHEVRFDNSKAYVETVRKLSKAGTLFLLLAGNPNEMTSKYSPPHVTEEEIRADFSALFDFEWIKETRFETSQPQDVGPLAWSVMMKRK
ncbi:MAG: class I SAM-dependent methyltransferase [Terriglobia bacterium]